MLKKVGQKGMVLAAKKEAEANNEWQPSLISALIRLHTCSWLEDCLQFDLFNGVDGNDNCPFHTRQIELMENASF